MCCPLKTDELDLGGCFGWRAGHANSWLNIPEKISSIYKSSHVLAAKPCLSVRLWCLIRRQSGTLTFFRRRLLFSAAPPLHLEPPHGGGNVAETSSSSSSSTSSSHLIFLFLHPDIPADAKQQRSRKLAVI